VCFSHDNDDRIPTFQSGFDKASIALYHRTVIYVERDFVAMPDRCGVFIRCVEIMTRQASADEPLTFENRL